MSYVATNRIPCDAMGNEVDLDAEYMYRRDGLKLKVICFEYYKSHDSGYNWFILASIDSSNEIKVDRYKVSELYVEKPYNQNKQNVLNELHSLSRKVGNLMFALTFDGTQYSILRNYVYINLGYETGAFVGDSSLEVLKLILLYFEKSLSSIINKLEDNNA